MVANCLGTGPVPTPAAGEEQRWQRVLGETGCRAAPAIRRRGCGRWVATSSARLRARRCPRRRPRRSRERLSRRGRRRLGRARTRANGGCRPQCHPPIPSSPAVGQWWLQPAAAATSSIDERLRGVPGFQRRGRQRPGRAGAGGGARHRHHRAPRPGRRACCRLRLRQRPSSRQRWRRPRQRSHRPGRLGRRRQTCATRAFAGCAVEDSSWHGTIVAGILAAHTDNAIGGRRRSTGRRASCRCAWPASAAPKCADIVDGMRWAGRAAAVRRAVAAATRTRRAWSTSASAAAALRARVSERRSTNCARAGVVVVAAAGNGTARRRGRPTAAAWSAWRAEPRRLQDQLLELRPRARRQRHGHRGGDDDADGAWGSAARPTAAC